MDAAERNKLDVVLCAYSSEYARVCRMRLWHEGGEKLFIVGEADTDSDVGGLELVRGLGYAPGELLEVEAVIDDTGGANVNEAGIVR